jgi:hypothetical protein
MTTRRAFLTRFGAAFTAVTGVALAQKGITENGKAVVCKEDSVTCPVCKQKTCRLLDAPVVVGNNSREYPDQAQMYEFKILCCENCRAAFFG